MTAPNTRVLTVGRHRVPVVLPSVGDARLRQSMVLLTLQLLGQTSLEFDLSIAQIVIALGTCAVIDVSIALWRARMLVWPASALLTGNGIALIARVPGTRHGDWWSLRGWWVFVLVSIVAMSSKHLVRREGRHIFNPANAGLVLAFLVLGVRTVDPQPLWWGDLDAGLVAAVVLILLGGVFVLRPLGLLPLSLAFAFVFSALVAVLALSGHCMTAPWHVGPVCGASYWWTVAMSPELLVFAIFMITDPRTTPAARAARVVFGASVAAVAALLVAPQRSEFATKVAVLASLTIVCAAMPLVRGLAGCLPTFSARLRRGRHVAVGLCGVMVVVAVPLSGTAARPASFVPREPTVAEADRPVLPAGFPTVALDPSVGRHAPWYTIGSAERRALDIVDDLRLLDDAIRVGDRRKASSVATDQREEEAMEAIERGEGRGQREVARHEVTSVVATMVRAPRSRQPSPEVGFLVTGTRTVDVLDGASTPPVLIDSRIEPFQELLRLRPNPTIAYGRYLIVGPGEAWD